jgi:hypothetical protein
MYLMRMMAGIDTVGLFRIAKQGGRVGGRSSDPWALNRGLSSTTEKWPIVIAWYVERECVRGTETQRNGQIVFKGTSPWSLEYRRNS